MDRPPRTTSAARIVAAARYALSPQPRAAEEAVHQALHARASFVLALDVLRHRLDRRR